MQCRSTAYVLTNPICSFVRQLTHLLLVCVLRLSGWPQSAGSWFCSVLGKCKGIPSILSFSQPLPCVLKCRLSIFRCNDFFVLWIWWHHHVHTPYPHFLTFVFVWSACRKVTFFLFLNLARLCLKKINWCVEIVGCFQKSKFKFKWPEEMV